MDKEIFFTIVIPAYNVETCIHDALSSLLRQTIDEDLIEIIIVNDCSTDKTLSILSKYSSEYPQIQLLNNNINSGQGFSRNKGTAHARGKYITFLDADDTLPINALKTYYDVLKNVSVDMAYADIARIGPNGDIIGYVNRNILCDISHEDLIAKVIGGSISFCAVGAVYAREFINCYNIKFGEGYFYEDIEFVALTCMNARNIQVIPQALYQWRITLGSTTNSMSEKKMTNAVFAVHKLYKILESLGKLDKLRPSWRRFAMSFIPLIQRRINSFADEPQKLAANFKQMIAESTIFQREALIAPLFEKIAQSNTALAANTNELCAILAADTASAVILVTASAGELTNFIILGNKLADMGIKSTILHISKSKTELTVNRILSNDLIRYHKIDTAMIYPCFYNAKAYLFGESVNFLLGLAADLRLRRIPIIMYACGPQNVENTQNTLQLACIADLILASGGTRSSFSRNIPLFEAGIPSVDTIWATKPTPLPSNQVILIDKSSLSSYDSFISSAAAICDELDVNYSFYDTCLDCQGFQAAINSASLLISKDFIHVLSAMAAGRRAIWVMPNGSQPESPLCVCSEQSLRQKLAEYLEYQGTAELNKEEAFALLRTTGNIGLNQKATEEAALLIVNLLNNDRHCFQQRLEYFAGQAPLAQRKSHSPTRLMHSFSKAPSWKKAILFMLLDFETFKQKIKLTLFKH